MRTDVLVPAVATGVLALLVLGCPGDAPCGTDQPAAARADMLAADGMAFAFEGFTGGENNDCPPPGTFPGPGDPISVTIIGLQPGTGLALTLCLRHPDQIGGAALDLADKTQVELHGASARAPSGCTYSFVPGATPTGTVRFDGFCVQKGKAYNMTLAGQVNGVRSCPSDAGPPVDTLMPLTLQGTVLVNVAP